VVAAGATAPSLFVLSSAGYGFTEAVLGQGDTHHRAMGDLALDGRPTRWLGLALRLDGRYDLHVVPGQPRDSGAVADPRLYVRIDRSLPGGALRLGARFGLWLPGGNAPSIAWSAITPELVGAATYAPARARWSVSVNAGFRLDRSARSAANAPLLSAGDRSALEVSAFDELLLALAATFGRGSVQGFVEASLEALVGAGAPALTASPLRLGGGARVALGARVRLEAAIEVAAGSHPDLGAEAPLAPVPPRIAAAVGLAYRFGEPARAAALPPQPEAMRAPAPPSPRQPPSSPPPAAPATIQLTGSVVAADGGELVDLSVEVASDDGADEVAPDSDGRFTFDGRLGQTLAVTAEAPGYALATEQVTLRGPQSTALTLTLQRRLPSGQLRGLVRSFKGRGLDAEIRIEPTGQTLRTEEGRFQIDVAPGAYEVTIAAASYETQVRRVDVEQNGVTVLNVDLRSAP